MTRSESKLNGYHPSACVRLGHSSRATIAVVASATVVAMTFLLAPMVHAQVLFSTGFEPPTYSVGDLNGQDGWMTDIGPTSQVQVMNSGPLVGTQAIRIFSAGGVPDTRAIRNLAHDATSQVLTLSSNIVFTSGTRSDYEFNSVFGTGGFLGGLRVLGTNELVLETGLASQATGVFADFSFQSISLEFDFNTGLASATRNGALIASGVAFDAGNSMLTQVAAGRLLVPRFDAVQLDEFSVEAVAAVPEPTTLALFGLGLAGAGVARRRKRKA